MYSTSQIKAKIETDGTPISLRDLSYFFYLLRALYVAGYEELSGTGQLEVDHSYQARVLSRLIVRRISDSPRRFADFATETLSEAEDIRVVDIHRQNPLSIVFEGIPLLLMAGAIIAGGSIALNPETVELPKLREMIAHIRSAIRH